MDNQFYGWYDDASQGVRSPTYDPPHTGPCLYCGCAISGKDIRTHSMMFASGYARRSYFYRTHKSCAVKDDSGTAVDEYRFSNDPAQRRLTWLTPSPTASM